MRTLEQSLMDLAEDERPLVEVLAPDGSVARSYSYRHVVRAAAELARTLRERPVRDRGARGAGDPTDPGQLQVGVVTANGPEFLVADFAVLGARGVEVPVPLAFTAEQAAAMLEDIDICLADEAGARRLREWGAEKVLPPGVPLQVLDLERPAASETAAPLFPRAEATARLCKIIHTSGTTSRPKGVCIRESALEELIGSLRAAMPPRAYRRYLSLVPLSLLIEQVTAVYLVVCDAGTVVLLPPEVPLVGTSSFAPQAVLPHVRAARPSALVITPALAEAMASRAAEARASGRDPVTDLFGRAEAPLVCCGGAPVDADMLRALDDHGIAVHEGYGLSENSSVVSWNTPAARRVGSVGRPLRHVRVRTAPDGELLVKSTSLFAGYKGGDDPSGCDVDEEGWLHTGDLAVIEDGFVWIRGRKKSVIITSAGRNVAPEWVEAQYRSHPAVLAVAVVGDGLPALHGLFLVDPRVRPEAVRAELDSLGHERLSQVERVEVAHVVPADESLHAEFFTVTGRPRRSAVQAAIAAGRFA
ncbi:AMP-binding protein [Streptomyces capitiformicae]|uniref:Long-chain acyl-CoA synthetase n=1 Tax=Streptomyces capitiformicae TaxID=2014920 RepID=A0A918ZK35_9ACTN|nr:AMP-binding protein [Streptomyces capitiformicae]GHE57358.1 long-chain acyl-CoA synthetase [Streptomyces capitiformicae]